MREDVVGRLFSTLNLQNTGAIERCIKLVEERSDSPIETMFASAFLLLTELSLIGRRDEAIPFVLGTEPKERFLSAVQQYQWKQYRIDFAIFAEGQPSAFVECDGHDFHERTQEQAEHDRARDRAIQAAGILALRFTGREIWRDPFECAQSAFMAAYEHFMRHSGQPESLEFSRESLGDS